MVSMMVGAFLKVAFWRRSALENVKNSFSTAAQTLGSPPSIFREKVAIKLLFKWQAAGP
jgi:hypothetical protein